MRLSRRAFLSTTALASVAPLLPAMGAMPVAEPTVPFVHHVITGGPSLSCGTTAERAIASPMPSDPIWWADDIAGIHAGAFT